MRIAITGGAGYVGSKLVPYLLRKEHKVTVLDTFWYGDHLGEHQNLLKINGDIRHTGSLRKAFENQEAVIHLACVSNDPSFDMNRELGKQINYDCFKQILHTLKEKEVERFIYASSSSVYGVSEKENVDEDTEKKPLTDYSKFKLACELELKAYGTGNTWTIIRPATVCGFSPRMRLDLVVNILTIQALINKKITLYGRTQMRPNINIKDMVLAYELLLNSPTDKVNEQIFNVGYDNMSLGVIAELVRHSLKESGIEIIDEPMKDERSYKVCSDRIYQVLGFKPKHSIKDAIQSIKIAYKDGLLVDPLNNPVYCNIKQMKELKAYEGSI